MPFKLETLVGIIPQPNVEKTLRIKTGNELKTGCYYKVAQDFHKNIVLMDKRDGCREDQGGGTVKDEIRTFQESGVHKTTLTYGPITDFQYPAQKRKNREREKYINNINGHAIYLQTLPLFIKTGGRNWCACRPLIVWSGRYASFFRASLAPFNIPEIAPLATVRDLFPLLFTHQPIK